jgi:hypothetical protein
MYRAEARFLRALSYYHALDMFGAVPFVTEKDAVGSFLPKQISKADLFAYIESELKAIEVDMAEPRKNEYARADKAAAWTLLTKLYLNAEVYIGAGKYTEAITAAKKVIGAGYAIEAKYQNLFLADNNKSAEIIFPIAFDGTKTKTWGGMTFMVHAPVGGKMNPDEFGINGGWGGLRTTQQFVDHFDDKSGKTDSRAMFFTDGQNKEVADIYGFDMSICNMHTLVPMTQPHIRTQEVINLFQEKQSQGGILHSQLRRQRWLSIQHMGLSQRLVPMVTKFSGSPRQ